MPKVIAIFLLSYFTLVFGDVQYQVFESLWSGIPFKSHPQVDTLLQTFDRRGGQVSFSREDFLKEFPEFVKATKRCPIPQTARAGGMLTSHGLGLWTILRKLQPEIVIENGIFKGFSTWLIRQALPNTKIICLDPNDPSRYPQHYIDPEALYMTDTKFQDFSQIDWTSLSLNMSSTLLIFDDHMDHLRRIRESRPFGFRHLVFDDNYVPLTGDCYSMKQILLGSTAVHKMLDSGRAQIPVRDKFAQVYSEIPFSTHSDAHHHELLGYLKNYFEVPALLPYTGYMKQEVIGLYSPSEWMALRWTDPLFPNMTELVKTEWIAQHTDFTYDTMRGYQGFCYAELSYE